MGFANASAASRSSTGYAVMAGAMVLLLASGWMGAPGARQAAEAMPGRNLEFLHSAAGIDGRIQIIRRMEKAMLANAAVPRRATDYRQRRDQARRRIDELMLVAGAAAGSDEQGGRLDRLAAITRSADARSAQIDSFFVVQPKGETR
jgi:hypothetical protein